jgi:hypothetical protein
MADRVPVRQEKTRKDKRKDKTVYVSEVMAQNKKTK